MVESGLVSAVAGKPFKEAVFVEQHHKFEKVILRHFDWNFLKRVILLKTSALKILPFEVFFQSELILQAEGPVRVLSEFTALEIENKEEAGVNIVLHDAKSTS